MTFAALAAGHCVGIVPLSLIIVPALVVLIIVLGQSLASNIRSQIHVA